MLDVEGIVRRAGECRPVRESWGTQYSRPPVESLTQPSESDFARKPERIGLEEEGWMEIGGNASAERVVLLSDPETVSGG